MGWGGENEYISLKIMRLFHGDVFFYTSTSQKIDTKTAC